MKLILIRHGETDLNKNGAFQGTSDMVLSDKGREQVQRLGERMKQIKIDRIISSPKKRAVETAAAIAQHHNLGIEIDDRLQEVDFGHWEGKVLWEMCRDGDEDAILYQNEKNFYPIPGEGSLNRARWRIGGFIDELKLSYWETDKTIVLVGHAAIFRMAMFHLLDMGNNFYRKFAPSNAGITVFQISKKSGARVVTFNDTSHLSDDW